MSFSFLAQPQELIINEQLIQLPIEDLLAACSSTPQLNTLCQNKALWQARIRAEYPELDVRDIEDPREFYLRQTLFGGQIYVHHTRKDQIEYIEHIPTGTIAYDRLFERIKEIAERLKPKGKDYYIMYSRVKEYKDLDYFAISNIKTYDTRDILRLDPIAHQTANTVYIEPGPALKIMIVDIVYTEPSNEIIKAIDQYKVVTDIYPSTRGAIVQIGNKLLTRKQAAHLVREYRSTIKFIVYRIEEFHIKENSSLYRREVEYVTKLTEEKYLQYQIERDALNAKKELEYKLYNIDGVLSNIAKVNITQDMLDSLGFATYNEFITFQQDNLNNLSNSEVESLISRIEVLSQYSILNSTIKPVSTIIFASDGRRVIV